MNLTKNHLEKSKIESAAAEAYKKGDYSTAITNQLKIINWPDAEKNLRDYQLLVLYLYSSGDYDAALKFNLHITKIWPENAASFHNAGVCQSQLGRFKEAIVSLKKSIDLKPDQANVHDALALCYAKIGEYEKSKVHGQKALLGKYYSCKTVDEGLTLNQIEIPEFSIDNPAKNVIAFSLWGATERYLKGAMDNAAIARHIYPEWRCRFYCDETVPEHVIGFLLSQGADVVMMPPQQYQFEGLFWRFLVANDSSVERFLVRDVDSLLNVREREAVQEWISSGHYFHLMRDYYTHTALILAGMWGGVAGVLPDISRLYQSYLTAPDKTNTCDQLFLRERIWPLIEQDVCVHDSVFDCLGAVPFPDTARLKQDRHVGQDNYFVTRNWEPEFGHISSGNSDYTLSDLSCDERKKFVFSITTGRSGTTFLAQLIDSNITDAEVHHERSGFEVAGYNTPSSSHMMQFNSLGNTVHVREFWEQKLNTIRYGKGETYVEVSHFLAKGGLLENIGLLGPDTDVDIVILQRDKLKIAWSLANRFDLYNYGFGWLFYLDPRYPKNIVSFDYFINFGMWGVCAWYCYEIEARALYYERILSKKHNVKFHRVNLEDLTNKDGASKLLTDLGLDVTATQVVIPGKENSQNEWMFGERDKKSLNKIIQEAPFDVDQVVSRYIRSGKRIG